MKSLHACAGETFEQPSPHPTNPGEIMFNKFAIDDSASPHHGSRGFTHLTDDPIEAEDFLMHLLAARVRITAI